MTFKKTVLFGVWLSALALAGCGPDGSGQECSCRMTINGETKETSVCGGLLCFESVGEYFKCGAGGAMEVSSCG